MSRPGFRVQKQSPASRQAGVTYSLSVEAEAELAEAIDFYALNVSRKVAVNFLAMHDAPSIGRHARRSA